MAAFHKLAPDFIKEGRLFWLRTPLWIIKTKNKNYYYYNDKEMNEAYGKIKGERTRAKGIGALTAEQAKESMFSKEFQRLEPIEWNLEAIKILEELMGEDIQTRKDFVFSKIDFTEVQE